MSRSRQNLGRWGETLAADYLQERGYTLVERNARTAFGEIDLVMRQPAPTGPVTVFVEVKTRRSQAFGLPEEAITPRKQAHLLDSAQAYLQAHPELDGDWRIDVIAIQRSDAAAPPEIIHFENAVS
ncbi:MAG: YraN family protein [Chloroflexota bacterium]